MSALHCVVVWEWQCEGSWLPHGPGVARTLERAHAKRLTRVVLADAEPALRGHTVNLRSLTQSWEGPEGEVVERKVRRACYSVHSPGGRGARWEWGLPWRALPMRWQCALEEGWAAGEGGVRLDGWVACLRRMEIGQAAPQQPQRLLRRVPQPPYPLARAPHAPPPPPQRHTHDAQSSGRNAARIPQQHTGSSVHSVRSDRSVQSVQSAPVACSPCQPLCRTGARSVSPKERRGRGLARQILHNLGRLRPRDASVSPRPEPRASPQPDTGSEPPARRHSVDTVSTYLSQESKDSIGQQRTGSVGELLDVSSGSDEVFAPEPSWAEAVEVPQWGAVCPCCLAALRPRGTGLAVVRLPRCHHQLHLACLSAVLASEGRLDCRVCGLSYDAAATNAPPAALPRAQPPGSMAWSVQAAALATHPGVPTIIVTYNFQSGRQGPSDPMPGAPYYAVGFPRHSVLPDCALGRLVLATLARAWAQGRLFALATSHTTGRDHVLAWSTPPPPQSRDHYARLATLERAEDALSAALRRLTALLGPETTAATASDLCHSSATSV